MLRLILSTDWIAGREAVLELVAEEVRRRRPGQILMVPELISHDMERRLSAAAGAQPAKIARAVSTAAARVRFFLFSIACSPS